MDKLIITHKVVELIPSTIAEVEDKEGWAFLGEVGTWLQKNLPISTQDTRGTENGHIWSNRQDKLK